MKPVLFLDVDGVLNVLPTYSPEKGDWDFDAPTDDWDDLVTHQVTDRRMQTWPMRFSASMGTALHLLSDRVEIRWLTTWADDANDKIAPLVGLPGPYPVAARPGWGSKPWKLFAVQDFNEEEPDRPFIWIDDDAIDISAYEWSMALPVKHLLVRTHPGKGITKADLAAIEVFVNEQAEKV